MQIVSWNSHQKFREKIKHFSPDSIDVLIVQECENTDSAARAYENAGWKHVWTGDNIHKGLGIFVPISIEIEKLDWGISDCKYFLPVQINQSMVMVGVWAKGGKINSVRYAGQITRFLDRHLSEIECSSAFIIGDFNSNSIWDKRHKTANHTQNNMRLNSIGLQSLYHVIHSAENGVENHPTFYLSYDKAKPYHIDYAYLPVSFLANSQIEIGMPDEWLKYSDHMPLFITAATNNEQQRPN